MSPELTILVVDDNLSLVNTMEDILAYKNYMVHTASSGKEALQILQDQPVNVLLTDIKMPDMDGLVLFRKVREIRPGLITFFMTAYSADEVIQQGIAEGVKAVLTKPVDIDLFLSMLVAVAQINKCPKK